MSTLTPRSNSRPASLWLSLGLALLLVTALLWGLQGVASTHADPGVLYVNGASGQDTLACGTTTLAPCRTISYTLNSRASTGDALLIAAGTYTENLTINGAISLTLHGGYSISGTVWLPEDTETIIDGSGTISQPVVIVGDGGGSVVLENLTLRGGRAPGAGGISAGDVNLTLRRCVIRDNTAVGDGGGGAVSGPTTRWTIIDSLIVDNQVDSPAGPGNTGGAGGVRAGPFSSVTLVNTLVANNKGDAGIHVNASLTMVNVTLADNDGDVIFNPINPSTLAITNSIVYSQFTFLTGCPIGSSCSVNYSDVQGWTGGGTGNIKVDPRFASGDDYRLRPNSPCIDTGTNTGAPDHDLAQTPRPLDGNGDGTAVTDMGAFEFKLYRIFLPITLRNS